MKDNDLRLTLRSTPAVLPAYMDHWQGNDSRGRLGDLARNNPKLAALKRAAEETIAWAQHRGH